MASQVNTKFVTGLAVALVAVGGTVGTVGYLKLKKSDSELAALGDAQAAKGDWENAILFYSKAVNKDQSNPEWLRKWIHALEQTTPDVAQAYQERYFGEYLGAKRALAGVLGGSPEGISLQDDLFRRSYTLHTRMGSDIRGWENELTQVNRTLGGYTGPDAEEAIKPLLKYRALPRVHLLGLGSGVSQADLAQARSDLEAALALDDKDELAAIGLSRLLSTQAQRLRLAGNPAAAAPLAAEAMQTLRSFTERNPGSASALLALAQLEISEAGFASAGGRGRPSDVFGAARGTLEKLASAIAADTAGRVDESVVGGAAELAAGLPEAGGPTRALEIVRTAMRARPDNALLMTAEGLLLNRMGQSEESLAALQRVVDLPNRPLSLEGVLLFDQRVRAVSQQVEVVLGKWTPGMSDAERDALFARVKTYRDSLASRIGEDRPALRYIDARLAFGRNDLVAARRLLAQYNEDTGERDPRALTLLGQILTMQGSHAGASAQFRRALELEPNNVQALLGQASVEMAQQRWESAAEFARRAQRVDPNNPAVAERLRVLEDIARGDEAQDPMLRAMMEADALVNRADPDFRGAAAIVQRVVRENGQRPELVARLAQLLASAGDRAAAVAALDEGIQANPGDRRLTQIRTALASEDPVQGGLAAIDQSESSDLQKALLRYNVFARAGRAAEAEAELAKARSIAPEDPSVVELSFNHALMRREADAARRLAEVATRINADRLEGATYTARLEIAEGRYQRAAALLERALSTDPFNAGVWRLLGDTRLANGQHEAAVRAYGESLGIRADDPAAVKGQLRALYQLGRVDEALGQARSHSTRFAGDPEFVDLLLDLETVAPSGDRAAALQRRRQLAESRPTDLRNRSQLASLLIDMRDWAGAQEQIGSLAQQAPQSGDVLTLNVRWNVGQGRFDEARGAADAFVQAQPAEARNETPYLVLASALLGAREYDRAIAALNEARTLQDPKVMRADRELATVYFSTGQFEQALEVYGRLHSARAEDPNHVIAKGRIESLLFLNRPAEARDALGRLGNAVDGDSDLLILSAQTAAQLGERRRAKDLFDRAVAVAPERPLPYFKRYEFLASEPDLVLDAEADLRRVIQLQPTFPTARQRLADLYMSLGRTPEALDQLRQAVADNPNDGQARLRLVRTLLGRGDTIGAIQAVDAAIQAAGPNATAWLVTAGELFLGAGLAQQASGYLERAWAASPVPQVAAMYVEALLSRQPADVNTARRVLATRDLGTESDLVLLAQRARMANLAGQRDAVGRDLSAALALVPAENPQAAMVFLDLLAKALPDAQARLEFLRGAQAPAGMGKWLELAKFLAMMGNPAMRSEAAAGLTVLAGEPDNLAVAFMAARTAALEAYTAGRYEDAAALFRRSVEINPRDGEMNNNLAYTLARHLNRAADALPHAEAAARLMPQSGSVLDTLGMTYMMNGRLAEADTTLRRALSLAATPTERIPILLHQAELAARRSDRFEASRGLERAEEAMRREPQARERYQPEYEAVKRVIDSL